MLKKVAKSIASLVLTSACFQNVYAQAFLVMKTDDDIRGSVATIVKLRQEILAHGLTLSVEDGSDEVFVTWPTLGTEGDKTLQRELFKTIKSAMSDGGEDVYLTVDEPSEEIMVRRATGLWFSKLDAFEDGKTCEGCSTSYEKVKQEFEEEK